VDLPAKVDGLFSNGAPALAGYCWPSCSLGRHHHQWQSPVDDEYPRAKVRGAGADLLPQDMIIFAVTALVFATGVVILPRRSDASGAAGPVRRR